MEQGVHHPELARGATVISTAAIRASIAGTLAYAVLPVPLFVFIATAFDAVVGAVMAVGIVRRVSSSRGLLGVELSARAAMLWAATLPVFGGEYLDLFASWAWPGSSVGTVLVWFAPAFVGRIAIVLLADAWRAPNLHPDERARRVLLAVGVTVLMTGACVALLLARTR